jgi:protein TonB
MSKFSIYSKSWIDLVFENKNQSYGAFQLRQKSDETTLLAFCLGLTVIATVFTIPIFISSFNSNPEHPLTAPVLEYPVIQVSNYQPTPPKLPEKSAVAIATKEPSTEVDKKTLVNPEIVQSAAATPNITATTTVTTSTVEKGATNNNEGAPPQSENEKGKSLINIPTSEDELNSTITVDKLPEFPGGLEAFYSSVGKKFEAFEVEETVTVYLSFVIEKDGNMTDIKVIKSATPSLDREAIRVLQSIRTKWKPGIKDGRNVRTLYRLPIKVKKQ